MQVEGVHHLHGRIFIYLADHLTGCHPVAHLHRRIGDIAIAAYPTAPMVYADLSSPVGIIGHQPADRASGCSLHLCPLIGSEINR